MLDQSPVTWNTAKRLFRGADIAYMKMLGYYLDDPAWVRDNLEGSVLPRIIDGTMPPSPPFALWTSDMIQALRAWQEAGFPVSDDEIAMEEQRFIALSEFLTGFDDLSDDVELAHAYHQRLLSRPVNQGGADPEVLSALIESFHTDELNVFEQKLEEPEKKGAAQTVILLWYTAAFINLANGFPASPDATGKDQYTSGLVWRAIEAHPMGYSSEGYFDHRQNGYSLGGEPYWKYKPQGDGQNTGLGPKSVEPRRRRGE